jgi:hypothetical protein
MFLNERGGIEADLTVTRLSETAFLLVVPGATCSAIWPGCGGIWAMICRHHRCDGGRGGAVPDGAAGARRDGKVSPADFSNAPIPLARRGKSRSAWAWPARTA